MLKKNLSTLIIFILLPIAVGMISSVLAGNIAGTYSQLNQPELSPPAAVFPIIWTILYTLMGISSFLIFISDSPYKEKALWIYFLQLFIIFLWSPIFFGLQLYLLGFLWLLLLVVLIVIMILRFYSIDPVAAYLLIPYLLWCIFAAYLSFGIYARNT
ncbi:TspO/MBR family protein [Anaerocolumna cellulosilytica]|uniref:TspO/MBR family protein n=1 Tax=Anaerocolumna cellulosilytica TaxID=433286 RepID=UPI0016163F34|nr:TspO/MBR family protein [Anaerocolumna cellulosilytica]MBB5198062.1 tryptophan-rich sensory protein [Anaerocolumna cellulosilytica]